MQIDLLPEILQPPRILSDVEGALKAKQIKSDIDEYLKVRVNYPYNCHSVCQQKCIGHNIGAHMLAYASYISLPQFVFVHVLRLYCSFWPESSAHFILS
jgi:hypothetical protein